MRVRDQTSRPSGVAYDGSQPRALDEVGDAREVEVGEREQALLDRTVGRLRAARGVLRRFDGRDDQSFWMARSAAYASKISLRSFTCARKRGSAASGTCAVNCGP